MSNGLGVVTAPTAEPIQLQELKDYLRIDTTDDDVQLRQLIEAARSELERATRRQLVTATYKWYLTDWPTVFYVPKPPLQSVTHVKYYDGDSVQQTLSTDVYAVDTHHEPGRIRLKYGQSWPSSYRGGTGDIEIQFVCGYTTIPSEVKLALFKLVHQAYDTRMPVGASAWEIRAMKWRLAIPEIH
jgi:uncharacterized phiE125 gp8 family phage protein